MTTEQEIARLKRDFAHHLPRLLEIPEFKKALDEKNITRLWEIACQEERGNYKSISTARKFRDYY